jgi:uncharacterized protein YecE (DUF72 family)
MGDLKRMTRLYLGTSGWNYKHWSGVFSIRKD